MPDTGVMKVTLFLSDTLHKQMKELAKRKRVTLGNIYDQAMLMFLKHPANYMSTKQAQRLKKV